MNFHACFATLARSNVWATRTLFQHVDALPAARHGVDAAGGGARVSGGRQRQGLADLVAPGRDETTGRAVLWSEK